MFQVLLDYRLATIHNNIIAAEIYWYITHWYF